MVCLEGYPRLATTVLVFDLLESEEEEGIADLMESKEDAVVF